MAYHRAIVPDILWNVEAISNLEGDISAYNYLHTYECLSNSPYLEHEDRLMINFISISVKAFRVSTTATYLITKKKTYTKSKHNKWYSQ